MTSFQKFALYLRSLAFNVCALLITMVMSIVFLPCLIVPKHWIMWLPRFWVSVIFFLLKHITHLTFEVRGTPPQEPVLIASKHQSAFETLVFYKILKRPVYFLKKELLSLPIGGWYLRKVGIIAVERKSRKKLPFKQLCHDVQTNLNQGNSLILFPEGTRSEVGKRIPYKPGISLFYKALHVNVVPVALNSGLFWGRRSFLKYPGCITIEFLPPIPPGQDTKEFLKKLEEQIEQKSQELLDACPSV